MTDAQKAELAKPLRRFFWAQMGLILLLVVLSPDLPMDDPWLYVSGLAILIAVAALLPALYVAIAIRPLVANLPVSDEKITGSDVFANYSRSQVAWTLMIGVVLFAVSVLNGLTNGWDFWAVASAVIFAGMTLYTIFMVVVRRRALRQAG